MSVKVSTWTRKYQVAPRQQARAKIRELGMARLCVHRTPQHIYAQVIAAAATRCWPPRPRWIGAAPAVKPPAMRKPLRQSVN